MFSDPGLIIRWYCIKFQIIILMPQINKYQRNDDDDVCIFTKYLNNDPRIEH